MIRVAPVFLRLKYSCCFWGLQLLSRKKTSGDIAVRNGKITA
jgi:hypothetical protein